MSTTPDTPTQALASLTAQRADLSEKLAFVKADLLYQKGAIAEARATKNYKAKLEAERLCREDAASIVSIEAALSTINQEIKEAIRLRQGEFSSFTDSLLTVITERFGQPVRESLVLEARMRRNGAASAYAS